MFLLQHSSSKLREDNCRYIFTKNMLKTTADWWLWLHSLSEATVRTYYNFLWTFLLPLLPVPVDGQRCLTLSATASLFFDTFVRVSFLYVFSYLLNLTWSLTSSGNRCPLCRTILLITSRTVSIRLANLRSHFFVGVLMWCYCFISVEKI